MKSYIFSLLFLCFSVIGFAQNSISMQFEGEEVQATQAIDAKFLGVYMQDKGARKFQYNIQPQGSFYLTQTAGEWDLSQQQGIEWGIMVKDGQPVTAELTSFENGEMKTFEAMIILIKNTATQQYTYFNLYENDGVFYMDEAVKASEVAKN